MEYIPCIMCFKLSEAKNDKAIAKICSNCEAKKVGLGNFIKNIDFKKIEEVLGKHKEELKLTKDGELI